jgi:hypothetical protein
MPEQPGGLHAQAQAHALAALREVAGTHGVAALRVRVTAMMASYAACLIGRQRLAVLLR